MLNFFRFTALLIHATLFIFSLLPFSGFAQDTIVSKWPDTKTYTISPELSFTYERPKKLWKLPLRVIGNIPRNFADYSKKLWSYKSIDDVAAIGWSTAFLLIVDQVALNKVQQYSTKIGIDGKEDTNYLHINGGTIFYPRTINGVLFYLGDGTPHALNNLFFYAYGYLKKDYRAITTAEQLTEGLAFIGITTQIIKHITGRETPGTASQPGGHWDFFPNQIETIKHVSTYDAFPSGHVATTMVVTTIIADNYPEYKFLRPMGYFLTALLAYSMVNNGVHWASDYPLAIGLGYSFGKLISKRSRTVIAKKREYALRQLMM